MELNGALSNPQVPLELGTLLERKTGLLGGHRHALHRARIAPRTASVASIVYKILSEATTPMRAINIHRACEVELGRPVSWSTVKTCLSDHSRGARPRFQRVGHGLYAPLSTSQPLHAEVSSCDAGDRDPWIVLCTSGRRSRSTGSRLVLESSARDGGLTSQAMLPGSSVACGSGRGWGRVRGR